MALLLVMIFSLRLNWLPVFGAGTPAHLVLPAITLALPAAAMIARLVRASVLEVSSAEFVRVAAAKGLPPRQVLLRHVLPNSLSPTMSQATLAFGWAVLDTAGLAFLGVGVTAPTPEWGQMVGEGTRDVLGGVWWTSAIPGAFIFALVLAAVLIGNGLRGAQR